MTAAATGLTTLRHGTRRFDADALMPCAPAGPPPPSSTQREPLDARAPTPVPDPAAPPRRHTPPWFA